MNHFRPALVLLALFTVLTGIALPLLFTGLATAIVPNLANGSLIERDGKIIGSALIGQNFTAPGYFHPRPSATSYAADNSGGSNLGPTSKTLLDQVKANLAAIGARPVPGDMVTSSASGLDPDISPENAALQIPRIAAARHMSQQQLQTLIATHTQSRALGIFGQPRLNVLLLNLALDENPRGVRPRCRPRPPPGIAPCRRACPHQRARQPPCQAMGRRHGIA